MKKGPNTIFPPLFISISDLDLNKLLNTKICLWYMTRRECHSAVLDLVVYVYQCSRWEDVSKLALFF